MKNRLDVLIPNMECGNDNDPFDIYTRSDLDNRVLVLNESITDLVVERHAMCILRWNAEDKNLPIDKRHPIVIIINSNGGSALDGQAMVDAMLASKTPIMTVCMNIAASMAYLIYLAGKERVAFPNSCFLMHEGDMSLSNSTSKFKETMQFFDDMEIRTKAFILDRTDIDEKLYKKVYKQEYWMYAQKAKELGVVHKIIGEDCDIDVLFNT